MGLPPADAKGMIIVPDLKLRRRLYQIFCGPMEQDRKKRDSTTAFYGTQHNGGS